MYSDETMSVCHLAQKLLNSSSNFVYIWQLGQGLKARFCGLVVWSLDQKVNQSVDSPVNKKYKFQISAVSTGWMSSSSSSVPSWISFLVRHRSWQRNWLGHRWWGTWKQKSLSGVQKQSIHSGSQHHPEFLTGPGRFSWSGRVGVGGHVNVAMLLAVDHTHLHWIILHDKCLFAYNPNWFIDRNKHCQQHRLTYSSLYTLCPKKNEPGLTCCN